MGFFSQNCNGCGHPALSRWATNEINKWMTQVVAIDPKGDIVTGEYDGYGRIGETEYAVGDINTIWHKACWKVAGRPLEYQGESAYAHDQGYFFEDPEHDMAEPVVH